jgi:hypothetical protein
MRKAFGTFEFLKFKTETLPDFGTDFSLSFWVGIASRLPK